MVAFEAQAHLSNYGIADKSRMKVERKRQNYKIRWEDFYRSEQMANKVDLV